MFNANVIGKSVDSSGKLSVTVEFTDGVNTFVDIFSTSIAQDDTWLGRMAKNRCDQLDALVVFVGTISIGSIDLNVPPETPTAESLEHKTYREKLEQVVRYLNAVRQGIVEPNRAAFLAARDWLKTNFTEEMLDLFE